MNIKSNMEDPGVRRLSRRGKIARVPHRVREELNRRLLDGEPAGVLVQWLNQLPEVQAALKLHFNGAAISEQNLSEWKRGGFRDWVAKTEADELMADTLAEDLESNGGAGERRRHGAGEEPVEEVCVADRVAGWFFPHYVAAARGQLAAARTPGERWSVLRSICADLAGLRRSDHYVERLRIWQEKLRLETQVVTAEVKEVTKEEFVKWARAQPDIEKIIWPHRKRLTPKEKQRRIIQAFGIGRQKDINNPRNRPGQARRSKPPTPPEEATQDLPQTGQKIQVNPS